MGIKYVFNPFTGELDATDTTGLWTLSNSNIYYIDGNVSVGTSGTEISFFNDTITINPQLSNVHTVTDVGSRVAGMMSQSFMENTETNAGTKYGIIGNVEVVESNNQNSTSMLKGVQGAVDHIGSGTLTTTVGGDFFSEIMESGKITNAKGVQGNAVVSNSGSISKAYGVSSLVYGWDTSLINNSYGFYHYGYKAAGATTDSAYGLYIDALAGTNKWGVYINPVVDNYFAGNVGIGITTPDKLLEVDGDAGYVDATDMGVTDADFASKKYVDDNIPGDTVTVVEKYDTGWINTNDWTNRHLGTTAAPKNTDSNVTHNLNAPLSDLLVKVLISTDGTDANSFEITQTWAYGGSAGLVYGVTIYEVDNNNILLQTATQGIAYVVADGTAVVIDVEDWYYKIIVLKPETGSITMTSAGAIAPTGQIIMFGGANAPTGYVLCNGASLLRAGTYADLFAVIGVTFGTADGTHFNVPDMRGIFPRGAGVNGTLSDAGATGFTGVLGTYQNDKMQGHRHAQSIGATGIMTAADVNLQTPGAGTSAQFQVLSILDPSADGTNGTPRTGTETNPANLGLTYIIKY